MVQDFKTSEYLKSIDILKERERHRGLNLQLGRVFWKKGKTINIIITRMQNLSEHLFISSIYTLICL